jgi:D-alanyl-D-alanine carboxypeptidase
MRSAAKRRGLRLFPFLAALALGAGAAAAQPALLFDVGTGEVLAHQEAFRRWHPASLTKLMTAYTVFRAIDAGDVTLQSPIRMTRHAASMPPAKIGFKAGSVVTLDNALKIIMVKSANDMAMAIGENVGGSEKAFAGRMNAEAQRLGMTGSHWVNPNGLHAPDQYTTAHDLALLVRAIRLEYPQYADYFSIDGIVMGKTTIKTFNTLMGKYPGADGMKTGFICPSGFNLIGTATRSGRTLAAIVLGEASPAERAEHAVELLSAGFEPAPPAPAAAFAGAPAPAVQPQPVTLAGLQPYGDKREEAADMRDTVCRAKPKASEAKGEKPDEEPSEADAKPGLAELPNYQARIEVVTLGGATGPVPRAMLDAGGGVKEDVPLPLWRPDRPPPPGAEPLARAAPAASAPEATAQGDKGGAEAEGIAAEPLGFSDSSPSPYSGAPLGLLPEPLQERFGGPARPRL